jgi:hypothetical protein
MREIMQHVVFTLLLAFVLATGIIVAAMAAEPLGGIVAVSIFIAWIVVHSIWLGKYAPPPDPNEYH